MNCLIIISFLIYVSGLLVYAGNDWNLFPGRGYYKKQHKKDCVFPFTYREKTYNDCTNDGDNGELPWCSLSKHYKGKFKYCYDFRNADLSCLDTYTIGAKKYKGCNYLSSTAIYKQCQTNNSDVPYRNCIEEHLNFTEKSLLHFDECDKKYTDISKFHTMCIGPSDFAIPIPITNSEKVAILAKHNAFRNEVDAKFMFKLYWDDELAKMAQAHANMCAFDHDLAENRISPIYGYYNGQNMLMTKDIRGSLSSLLDTMFKSEKRYFRYGDTCAENDGNCLHYTQLMLSTLTRMGCGHTHCLYPDRVERFLVCNYIHSQYDDTAKTPYDKVDSPDENICPKHLRDGKLCDCGNKICDDNIEYLHARTCSCRKHQEKRSIHKRHAAIPIAGGKPFAL